MLMHGKDSATGGFDRAVVVTPQGEMWVTSAAPLTPAAAQQVQGNVASGATESGNPVAVGGRYSTGGLGLSTVLTDGQRGAAQVNARGFLAVAASAAGTAADGLASPAGVQDIAGNLRSWLVGGTLYNGSTWDRIRGYQGASIVRQNAAPAQQWNYAAAANGIAVNTAVAIKAAAGAGVQNFLTSMTLSNSAAVGGEVTILDGVTVLARYAVPAMMIQPMILRFADPLKSTANAALNVQCSIAGMALYVNAQGHTA